MSNLLKMCSFFYVFYNVVEARAGQHVSCGSVIKLQNLAYKVRLHSHDVKYGSGSGQQSVTGTDSTDDVNSHWVVLGISTEPCKRGYGTRSSRLKFVVSRCLTFSTASLWNAAVRYGCSTWRLRSSFILICFRRPSREVKKFPHSVTTVSETREITGGSSATEVTGNGKTASLSSTWIPTLI